MQERPGPVEQFNHGTYWGGSTETTRRRLFDAFHMALKQHSGWIFPKTLSFFKAWRSPAESIAPKRPDHGRSVHGEPKSTKDIEYCTQSQTQGAEHCTDAP